MLSRVKRILVKNEAVVRGYDAVRESLELRPRRADYRRAGREPSAAARRALADLRDDGIHFLPGFLSPELVAEMRTVVDAAVADGGYTYGGNLVGREVPPATCPARLNVIDPTLRSSAFVDAA